ncbi:MAG: hypothetical protein HY646_02710 [Acidobacteria bacterium]|nr:hypothetical protein [Acidobacteriota bacterium]
MNAGEKFLYVLAGIGLGAAVGILFSQRGRGSEVLERASSSVRNVVEKGKNVASIGRRRAAESVEAGRKI